MLLCLNIKEEELVGTTSKVSYLRLYVKDLMYDIGVVQISFTLIVYGWIFIIGTVSARLIFLLWALYQGSRGCGLLMAKC